MWYNQQGSAYNERFKFTGKERDDETGYDFFGARYYASTLPSWLSVDPLADKYPYISPYAYCAWNPIKYVDPNGKWVETAWDIANIGMDIASLKSNISAGNVGGAIVDGLGLALDVGATLLPGIPGGAGTVIKASRTADKVSDLGKSGKAINQVITATKSTYRQALQKATGKLGKGYDAHHTLPQKYRKEFEKLGINIDEPGNVVWRSKENHRQNSNQLRKEWDDFMSNPENRTTESIMKFRDKMEKKYFNNKTGDLQ
jgi:RHS repeat-associated protein